MMTNMVVEDTSFEDDQLAAMTTDDIIRATRLLDNEIRILKILEMNPEDEAEEDGANIDLDSQRKGKCVVLKTCTRQCLSVVPLKIFRWVIAGVAGIMSATFVAINLHAHIVSGGESWFLIMAGIFVLQLALAVVLKVYLFTVTVY